MAYKEGTARDHKDLLVEVVDFATANGWQIIRGQRNKRARAYFTNSSYVHSKQPYIYHEAVAFGCGDEGIIAQNWSHPLNLKGWTCFVTDIDAHLGVEAETTIRPYSYEVRAEYSSDEIFRDEAKFVFEPSTDRAPYAWVIEYSSEKEVWQVVDSQTGHTWTNGQSKTFTIDQTVPIEAKYWRMRVLSAAGSGRFITVGRLRFLDLGGAVLSNAYSPEMILKSRGYTRDREIFTFIRLTEMAVTNEGGHYNWEHGTFIGYIEDNRIEDQEHVQTKFTPLWNSVIPYRLRVNPQMISLSAKVSTVSEFMYLGFFFPYATPAQYPYPYLNAGGSGYRTTHWSSTESELHSNIQAPVENGDNHGSCSVMNPSLYWLEIDSSYGLSITDETERFCGISPKSDYCFDEEIYPNDDGTYALVPYVLYTAFGSAPMILGELDGIFWVTGVNLAFEDVITVNGKEYFVFQNCFQTHWGAYACMLME